MQWSRLDRRPRVLVREARLALRVEDADVPALPAVVDLRLPLPRGALRDAPDQLGGRRRGRQGIESVSISPVEVKIVEVSSRLARCVLTVDPRVTPLMVHPSAQIRLTLRDAGETRLSLL